MLILRLHNPLQTHFALRMPEWGLSLILAAFGVQIIMHPDTFDTSLAYSAIGRTIGRLAWAGYALGVALSWLISLLINGSTKLHARWTPIARLVCSLLAFLFWATNATFYILLLPQHPGLINNTGFAFMSLAIGAIIAREAGKLHGQRNG